MPTPAGSALAPAAPPAAPAPGAVPPHSVEAEQAVLGAILLSERAHYMFVVEEGLRSEDFYRGRHRAIFDAMLALFEGSGEIDVLSVTEELKSRGTLEDAGGPDEVAQLVTAVPAVGNLRRYAEIVKQLAHLRRLLDASYRIQSSVLSREGEPRDILEAAERTILEIRDGEGGEDFRPVGDVLHHEITRWQDLSRSGTQLTGVPSGFEDLDAITGGFQPGNLIILAARPSMGKSALVTNIAENVALHKTRPAAVAMFSLEMSESELAQRFVASQAGIKGDDLRKGRVKEDKWERVLRVAGDYERSRLYVDDSSDIGLLEVRAKARRLHQSLRDHGGLGLVIIDYLQLLRPDGKYDSRVQQVGEMSRGLKILARELAVPVIALSQLSRGVESRTDKRPMLSDLRECVTGDTLVVLSDGRRVPISDLVGTEPEVVAVDERDRLVHAQADAVWHVGRRDVFRVRLASGREITATGRHRIRSGAGWSTVDELSAGDRVALSRRLPEPIAPTRWSDDEVVLLGQLVGDGSYLKGQPLRYTTASEANSDAVRRAAERAFGARVTRHAGRGSWHQLVIAGNGNRWHPAGVGLWMRELGIHDQRSHEKRLPETAFELADEQLALLLRHLWATDGTIWTGTRSSGRRDARVAYATCSRGLAADVAAALLRLGIVARTTEVSSGGRTESMFHVVVSGAAAQARFLDVVGAHGPRVEQAERLAERLATLTASTSVDTLPVEVRKEVRGAMASAGVSQRAMAAMRGTSYGGTSHFGFAPSRTTVADYAVLLDDPQLAARAVSDLFWDRVLAVEPAGEQDVYDLTVPGAASWLADGIVSHNSGQIEQDADVVMFIYRDDYYHREDSEDPGVSELIIAKHRNGGLGDVRLSFQNEYPRFRSIAREAA